MSNSKLKLIHKSNLFSVSGSGSSSQTKKQAELFALAGSMLDFEGDACVNAANEGGVTGFGIDELVNRAGGFEMKDARRAFNGIPTGQAKYTSSFEHKKVKFVIHAVGPVFRDNTMSKDPIEVKFAQLKSAYENSMLRAAELGCESIAFCLISAGVFRGNVPLETVIGLGIEGILDFYKKNFGSSDEDNDNDDQVAKKEKNLSLTFPTKVCICAFTVDEQQALAKIVAKL
jgi:O-acetyl-ADP-ribose deacetylase (regulator of RNase III)